MRYFTLLTLALCLSLSAATHAADAPHPAVSGAPVTLAQPAAAPSPSPYVAVAEPAAPPQWAQDLMQTAQGLPVIGPIVSKALLYLGILSSILTMLVGFVLSVLAVISKVSNLAGLGVVAARVAAFKDGPIMYWIKFFSLFNAQKKPDESKA